MNIKYLTLFLGFAVAAPILQSLEAGDILGKLGNIITNRIRNKSIGTCLFKKGCERAAEYAHKDFLTSKTIAEPKRLQS